MEKYYPEVRGTILFGYFKRMAKLLTAIPADSRIQLGGDIYGAGINRCGRYLG